jgi:GNAT superfamily N-acetyltransferase
MAQPMTQTIRPASHSDAEPIAGLLDELGYATSVDEARAQLERVLAREDGGVLVAEVGDEVVGVAAYQLGVLLERARPQCRLTTLVVSADHRRHGVAQSLVASVESAAHDAGCFRVEVTTHPQRTDALAFYEAAGFTPRPHRLIKTLDT